MSAVESKSKMLNKMEADQCRRGEDHGRDTSVQLIRWGHPARLQRHQRPCKHSTSNEDACENDHEGDEDGPDPPWRPIGLLSAAIGPVVEGRIVSIFLLHPGILSLLRVDADPFACHAAVVEERAGLPFLESALGDAREWHISYRFDYG